MDKFEMLKETETEIQRLYPSPRVPAEGTPGLWKDLHGVADIQTDLELFEIISGNDFNELFDFRLSLEGYSPEYSNMVSGWTEHSAAAQKSLEAKYFLLKEPEHEFIGSVGIVPFKYDSIKIGRLQHVGVHPQFQGKGYGDILLKLVEQKTIQMGLSALCLKALPGHWTGAWYQRNGFLQIGMW